jgi:hypothetical protein
MLEGAGRLIARFLQRPVRGYEPFTPSDPDALRQSLEPGDVLLVEGNNHISGVIKYLTSAKAWFPRRCRNTFASTPGSAARSI